MVFDAMEAKDWIKVRELIATISWTPQYLEEKHGVRREELPVALLEADDINKISISLFFLSFLSSLY